jgi:hypothetical protein
VYSIEVQVCACLINQESLVHDLCVSFTLKFTRLTFRAPENETTSGERETRYTARRIADAPMARTAHPPSHVLCAMIGMRSGPFAIT